MCISTYIDVIQEIKKYIIHLLIYVATYVANTYFLIICYVFFTTSKYDSCVCDGVTV